MLEFEQLKLRLEGNEGELRDLKDALGYEHLKNEIEELEAKTAAPPKARRRYCRRPASLKIRLRHMKSFAPLTMICWCL